MPYHNLVVYDAARFHDAIAAKNAHQLHIAGRVHTADDQYARKLAAAMALAITIAGAFGVPAERCEFAIVTEGGSVEVLPAPPAGQPDYCDGMKQARQWLGFATVEAK